MHISKAFFICCFLLPLLCSCNQDEMEDNVHPSFTYNGDGLLFRLKTERFDNVDPSTRALDLTTPFDTIQAYVLNREGEIVTDSEVKCLKSGEIMAEGLRTGDYELLILAIKGEYAEDGATIHKIENTSSPWLSFDENVPARPLKAGYYYTKHPFSVVTGEVQQEEIRIPQAMGRASFDLQYMSDYVRETVVDCNFLPSTESRCSSALHANGKYSGSRSIEPFSLSEQTQLLLFPTVDGGLSGKVVLKTTNHRKESFETKYDIRAIVSAAKDTPIEVQAVHPTDNEGLTIIKKLTQENFRTILADNEPASVYTNAKLRSFHVSKPLQINVDKDSLYLKFYSPVGIKDVRVTAKSAGMEEFVEFIHIDSIPAFADIRVPVQLKGMYRTETGRMEFFSAGDIDPATLTFNVSCPDPYWAKISQIKAKWKISFSLYGADPVTGGLNGSWKGIRPVHCREVVALYLNIGYMCTMPEFQQFVVNDLKLYDNNRYWMSKEEQAGIVPKLERLPELVVGLVSTEHNGAGGLGGGNVWGVTQACFFQHYKNEGQKCTNIFHELGHCMGYNHNSNMTYGGNDPSLGSRKGWANGGADWFYGANTSKFPVNSKEILKSYNSPNRYF